MSPEERSGFLEARVALVSPWQIGKRVHVTGIVFVWLSLCWVIKVQRIGQYMTLSCKYFL